MADLPPARLNQRNEKMQDFDVYDFLRRIDDGEFDLSLPEEIDRLSEGELEQLALVVANNVRAKAAGAG